VQSPSCGSRVPQRMAGLGSANAATRRRLRSCVGRSSRRLLSVNRLWSDPAAAHARQHIKWRSGDRAARARPAAAGPPDHRQTIAALGPMLLPLATVLCLQGAATSAIRRSRRDTPYPALSPDCYQNHAPLQARTPSYVDARGQLPDRYRR